MLGSTRSARKFLAAAVAGLIAGCSSMQPTPIMPTYPAKIGGRGGVSADQDAYCRQQAFQAAQAAKDSNVSAEVASTAVGAIAGAVIGNAASTSDRTVRTYGPRRVVTRHYSGHDYTGAGAATGAVVGAAASQGMIQDTQQVYDITYNNCVAAYANEAASTRRR